LMGKSIYSMSLQSLRKILALVPQTPVLFTHG
jgi:ABC-type multidrug transport system fused ATPase/permease subunit